MLYLAITEVAAQTAGQAVRAVDWCVVTLVLSVSGLAGGLAFHLVKNEGGFVYPHCVGGSSKLIRLGVLADILIGIVAANAIHVGISGIVRYDIDDTRFYTTFIAFGVLAGFGGATLLKALSEKLQETVTKRDFVDLQNQVAEETNRRELRESTKVARIVEDSLLYRRQPKESDADLLALRSEDLEKKKEDERRAEDILVLAFRATEAQHWVPAIKLIEKALKKGLEEKWRWAAHNLAGLSYHYADGIYPDWFVRAEKEYIRALDAAEKSGQPAATVDNQIAVTKTNLAYAHLDNGDAAACVKRCEEVVALEPKFVGSVPLIVEVAKLGLACGLIRQGRDDQAAQTMGTIADPGVVRYLFEDGSIKADIVERMRQMQNLPAGFRYLGSL